MSLPDIHIQLLNGSLGRVEQNDDGIAGLIVTGTAVSEKLELNKVYLLSSSRDLTTLGITAENNPLAYKDLMAFYQERGDGAELYLLVVAAATTLSQMGGSAADSPLRTLINYAKGRIRMVGFNRLPPEEYSADTETTGIDKDAVTAAASIHAVAESYAEKVNPFRCLIPALLWDGSTENLYKPRESSYNRVGFVMASDDNVGNTAAIGQMLGRATKYPVNYSLGRVKSGAIATQGWLTNGKTPEECEAMLAALDEAGYIIYRTFVRKNGYYPNDDPMAAPLSDDYSNLNLGRVVDKAIIITYLTYVEEILDSIEADDQGHLPVAVCASYERMIDSAVGNQMKDEISSFASYIDPAQDILTTSIVDVDCTIRPKGVLRDIKVKLGFENPALKQ